MALAATAACAPGCLGAEPKQTSIGPNRVEELRAFRGHPVYWLGREFERMPLSLADRARDEPGMPVRVHYGTCEIAGEGGCAPPVQIDMRLREDPVPEKAPQLRGVPAEFDDSDGLGGIVLYTGKIELTVSAENPAQAKRVAAKLRRLNGKLGASEDLPPPDG